MAINVEKFADEVDAKIGAEEAQLVRDLQFKLETSQVALKGAEERAKMLLDAKSHWAKRARTAESRLDAVIPALKTIAMQKLRSEFHPDEQDGDYELAYEVIVKMVRRAVERAGIMVALPSAPVVERRVTEQCGRGDRRSDS